MNSNSLKHVGAYERGRAITRIGPITICVVRYEEGGRGALMSSDDASADLLTRVMIAAGAHPGLLRVDAEDRQGLLVSPTPMGTVADLPALDWPLQKRLELFAKVASIVDAVHGMTFSYGSLNPAHVLLDADLEPVLVGPGIPPDPGDPYMPLESAAVERSGPASDIFSLGKLLAFLVCLEEPTQEPFGPQPGVDVNLQNLVRRCTSSSADERPANVGSLLSQLRSILDTAVEADPEPQPDGTSSVEELSVTSEPSEPSEPEAMTAASEPRPRSGRRSRVARAALGVTAAAACLGPAYFVDVPDGARFVVAAAVALAVTAIPGMVQRKRMLRYSLCALAAVIVFNLNPVEALNYLGKRQRLASGDPALAIPAAQRLLAQGNRQLAGSNLSGAQLRGLDLAYADLRGTDLSDADLREVDFTSAKLNGARFGGARIEGADLSGADGESLVSLDRSHCDRFTRLPSGWDCTEARPLAIAVADSR